MGVKVTLMDISSDFSGISVFFSVNSTTFGFWFDEDKNGKWVEHKKNRENLALMDKKVSGHIEKVLDKFLVFINEANKTIK